MIASNSGTDIEKYIKQKRSDLKNISDPTQKSKEEAALNEASSLHKTTKNHIFAQTTPEKTRDQLAADLTKLSQAFAKLTGGVKDEDLPEPVWSPARGNSGPYKPTVVTVDKLSKKGAQRKQPRGYQREFGRHGLAGNCRQGFDPSIG